MSEIKSIPEKDPPKRKAVRELVYSAIADSNQAVTIDQYEDFINEVIDIALKEAAGVEALTPIPVPFFPVFEVVLFGEQEDAPLGLLAWMFIIAAEDKKMAVSMALATTPLDFELDNEASTCVTLDALSPIKKILTSVKI